MTDIDMITDPASWPDPTVLPVKHADGRFGVILAGIPTTVFLGNVFGFADDDGNVCREDVIVQHEGRLDYGSVTELLSDGWEVD